MVHMILYLKYMCCCKHNGAILHCRSQKFASCNKFRHFALNMQNFSFFLKVHFTGISLFSQMDLWFRSINTNFQNFVQQLDSFACIIMTVLCCILLLYNLLIMISQDNFPFITFIGACCMSQGAPDAVFSTAVTSLKLEDGLDPNRVKCVVDNHGYAIYFSRGLIPFNKLVLSFFHITTHLGLFHSSFVINIICLCNPGQGKLIHNFLIYFIQAFRSISYSLKMLICCLVFCIRQFSNGSSSF